jgi:hypothetical protein
MKEGKLGKLLRQLGEQTSESVRPGLAEDIKRRIPQRFMPHRVGLDTINIMIDLRISKLTAAAVIIITLILCISFFGGADSDGLNFYKDGKLYVKYFLGGDEWQNNLLLGKLKYEYLAERGEEVVFYGDSIDGKDNNAVLIHWKVADNLYKVIFADLSEKEITGEQLVKLQSLMLRNRAK